MRPLRTVIVWSKKEDRTPGEQALRNLEAGVIRMMRRMGIRHLDDPAFPNAPDGQVIEIDICRGRRK